MPCGIDAGYGGGCVAGTPGDRIGPEFTFGLTMEQATDEPILIIKAGWVGKSLHTDFRPPGAGPYRLPEFTGNVLAVPTAPYWDETLEPPCWKNRRLTPPAAGAP